MNTSYSYLRKNILENKVESNTYCYNVALSESCGEIDFLFHLLTVQMLQL